MNKREKWFLFLATAVLVIGTVWYTYEKQIVSIRLQYADAALSGENGRIPFKEKTFTDTHDLDTFKHAMSKARKLSGDLDYAVMFWMSVTLRDGTQKKYVLNINEENEGDALLANVKSGKVFSIPKDEADPLRPIIYSE